MDDKSIDIKEYIKVYEGAYSLNQIKPLQNQTYKLFASSKVDIRIAHRSALCKSAGSFDNIRFFAAANEYFYMIPITTVKETIVGFILRGVVSKNYMTISKDFSDYGKKVPLMFGFDSSFADFDRQCSLKGGALPIIICEGSKDCLMLKKLYPFTLAMNRSSIGLNATILSNISNKFLLAYDNDYAGQEGMKRDKKVLRSRGCYVDSLKLHDGYKDCADYLGHPKDFKELAKSLKNALKNLFYDNNL